MTLLGLTGGIGMGKSTAAGFFLKWGVPIIDVDAIARHLVQPGQPAVVEIRQLFGSEMIASNGGVERERMARLVFSDGKARLKLESILHPRIRTEWQSQVNLWRDRGESRGIVVIPLLFETHSENLFDRVLCVNCSLATQRERLMTRGWSQFEIQQRIAAQWPSEKKASCSHFVVWSEGTYEVLEQQLQQIMLVLNQA